MGRPGVLRLRSGDGDVWLTEIQPFVFERGATPIERRLEPKAEQVRGLVTVGNKPLGRAHLTFVSEGELESIAFTSTADGRFTGFLPRFGRWHVRAKSESPHLAREADVDVIRSDRGAEIDAEVRLIPEGVEGELVDLESQLVTMRATVLLDHPASRLHRDEYVDGGTFRLGRLEDGDNEVQAYVGYRDATDGSRHHLVSEPIAVHVEHGTAEPAWLRVILRRLVPFRGRVETSAGVAVAGARVQRLEWGRESWQFQAARTDAEGRFVLQVPEGLPDVCLVISHQVQPTVLVRKSPSPDEQVLTIPGPGGTLVVDYPYPGSNLLDGLSLVIVHGGCVAAPGLFSSLRQRKKLVDSGNRWRYQLEKIEPGPYSVCAITRSELTASAADPPPALDDCVSGVLAPGGRLELTIRP